MPMPTPMPDADATMVELMAAYWQFAETHYVADGKPTDEQAGVRAAM